MIEWWGPIIHEYYAGTEGNGFVYCEHRGLARPQGHGRARPLARRRSTSSATTARSCPPARPAPIYFEGGGDVRVPQRPGEDGGVARTRRAGRTLGDVGYLDDDGFLYLTDRKAYMIISGGVNIYPQEAENVLVIHPKVVDVAVFGVPNDDFGEEVKAVVAAASTWPTPGPELERELIAYCRAHLADVKCPRSVDFRDELPRHPTGKLYKRLLKDEYWAGHGASRII